MDNARRIVAQICPDLEHNTTSYQHIYGSLAASMNALQQAPTEGSACISNNKNCQRASNTWQDRNVDLSSSDDIVTAFQRLPEVMDAHLIANACQYAAKDRNGLAG